MKKIDWQETFEKLENFRISIDGNFKPHEMKAKEILKNRAKAIGRELLPFKPPEKYIDVVEFILSYETYAIKSLYIKEIYPLKEITPIPCTPSFVMGIINVRREILSVIDIKKFFGLPEKGISDLNKVIITEGNGMKIGILADSIVGVRSIPSSDLQPPPSNLKGLEAEYLKGVVSGPLIVIDILKILSDKNIIVHEEVL